MYTDPKIEGRVEFYRHNGKWVINVIGCKWLIEDVLREIRANGDVLNITGSGSGDGPSCFNLTTTGKKADSNR